MIDEAVRIAKAAGETLLERFGRLSAGEIERIGRRDVVTAADRAAEDLITRELARAMPGVPVLGEEAARDAGRDALPDGPCWTPVKRPPTKVRSPETSRERTGVL